MYICKNCARLFEEPRRISERHGFDYGPFEEWCCCPYCSGDYVEAKECCECGEYISGNYVELTNGEYYCDECYQLHDIRDE